VRTKGGEANLTVQANVYLVLDVQLVVIESHLSLSDRTEGWANIGALGSAALAIGVVPLRASLNTALTGQEVQTDDHVLSRHCHWATI